MMMMISEDDLQKQRLIIMVIMTYKNQHCQKLIRLYDDTHAGTCCQNQRAQKLILEPPLIQVVALFIIMLRNMDVLIWIFSYGPAES